MAENEQNPMDSFKEKLTEAIKGNNKGEDIKDAIMGLLKSYGKSIPDFQLNLAMGSKKEMNAMSEQNHLIVDAFTKKVNHAIKGNNIAEDIKAAVKGLQKAYEAPVPGNEPKKHQTPEQHYQPQYKVNNPTCPIQKGHFYLGK
jgi:hypothetical protein